jgi:anaerobic ribonucleoside-triphosphate reductase activating protein
MNYSDLRKFDTTNGTHGISTTLFVSGCNFHCKGCFNEDAQDFSYGEPFTKEIEDKLIEYAKNPHVNHVSLLGGEIFHQDLDGILNLVKRIKQEVNKPIYIWTGFTWDKLIKDKDKLKILRYIDMIIDGQFELDKKDINLNWMGSLNQRVILVQPSLEQNKIIEYNWRD